MRSPVTGIVALILLLLVGIVVYRDWSGFS